MVAGPHLDNLHVKMNIMLVFDRAHFYYAIGKEHLGTLSLYDVGETRRLHDDKGCKIVFPELLEEIEHLSPEIIRIDERIEASEGIKTENAEIVPFVVLEELDHTIDHIKEIRFIVLGRILEPAPDITVIGYQ